MSEVTHVLSVMFSWPYGIVVGNLIASAITTLIAFSHLHWKQKQRHEELKQHISNTLGGNKDE